MPELVPDPDTLLSLEPEELGGLLLQLMNASGQRLHSRDGLINQLFEKRSGAACYPTSEKTPISEALTEAWCWLENEGLLIPDPAYDIRNSTYRLVSRRGRTIKTCDDFDSYRKARSIPWHLIHHAIREKVSGSFLRGAYETAVFEAFREVEIAVRDACMLRANDMGPALMRKAFASGNGPLSDPNLPISEQEAVAHLFAGAIGAYKNPHSHRHVGIASAEEAAEMVILASHLLRIVADRAAGIPAPAPM